MKKIQLFILLAMLLPSIGMRAGSDNLLPRPQKISLTTGAFNLSQSIQIVTPALSANDPQIAAELNSLIMSNGGQAVANSSVQIEVKLVSSVAGAQFQEEAYQLDVAAGKITIQAATLKGAYWAVQTLWQLAENSNGAVPACSVTDWAAFRIRGYMHDIGRSFIQFDVLKKHILKLSRYKINVFHWHLTDNQGWRLESKIYPQLNAPSSYTRIPGQYYTLAQAKELVTFANQHGVTIIPEIDMPGHSLAFRTAMGHSMLTDAGLTEIKNLLTEASAAFADTPWMHIGTDEVRTEDQGTMNWTVFVPQVVSHLRGLGKKVVSWNPGYSYASADIDMIQMWSSNGKPITGVPTIDSRYYYINHFDQFADIAGIYNSNIASQEKGSAQYAGVIMGVWNDRIMPNDTEIVSQNAFYASMLAIAERAWLGGGGAYIPQKGVMIDPLDTKFPDWERRFLFHKANYLQAEPIFYVKQTNIQWRITDAFPNGGNLSTVFPPETSATATSYTYNGTTYNTHTAVGAGIYLRHVWGTLIPAFYANPQTNSTAYAYTYVYSPAAQTVGVQLEFQNYGRSESDLAPLQGQWDYKQSKIWINDVAINPPTWLNTHTGRDNEITLKNENFPARTPISVTLKQGWNKVLMKLPVGAFSISQVRLVKWMFTCVFVTPDGKNAVDGLIYSPDKNMNPSLDFLIQAIDKANAVKATVQIGTEPGKYSAETVDAFTKQIADATAIRNNSTLTDTQYRTAAETLLAQTETFKKAINYPKVSTATKTYWYSLSTPLRTNGGFNFVSYKGDNTALFGEVFAANTPKFQWKLTQNADGTVNIVSRASETSYISPASAYNTALKAQSGVPTSGGWLFTPTYANNYFIITSGDVEFNQTGSAQSYQIYNWGGGNNTTDTGCQYLIRTEEIIGADALDSLTAVISDALALKNGAMAGTEPGQYPQEVFNSLNSAIDAANSVKNNSNATAYQQREAKKALSNAIIAFKNNINMPQASTADMNIFYSLTAERESRAIAYQADNAQLTGEPFVQNVDKFLWQLIPLSSGGYSIKNKTSKTYIGAESTGTPPKLFSYTGEQTSTGWEFQPTYNGLYFIITSGSSTQINQGNSAPYPLYNWGYNTAASPGGFNFTDVGCKYIIKTEAITSGVNSVLNDPINVWVENGYLKTNGNINEIKAFSVSGQELNIRNRLAKGVILVKTIYSTRKLVVN